MTLKYKLKTLDGLTDEQKKLYVEKDGEFILQVDGLPESSSDDSELASLKTKLDELLGEKKAEEDKRKAAEEEARKKAEEAALKSGDVEAIKKSYEEKLAGLQAEIDQRDKATAESNIQRSATEIAAKISDGANQKILARYVADRLRYEDGKVKVTDKDGNLTVSTLDELSNEFKTNEDFSSLITASKASGSGAQSGGDATTQASTAASTATQTYLSQVAE